MARIEYKEEDGWSKTNCPHADFLLGVGSIVCRKCKYHFMQSPVKRFVECLCPEGEMLIDLP